MTKEVPIAGNQPRKLPDYSEIFRPVHQAGLDRAHAQFHGRNPGLNTQQEFQERSRRKETFLRQAEPESGIYGVHIGEKGINVLPVINTFLHGDYVDDFRAKRFQNLYEAVAGSHGITSEEVRASVEYYYDHEEAIDAYFTVQQAVKVRDPEVGGNQPPKQLSLPSSK